MEIHNRFSLALIPLLVVLSTLLQYSCMGYGYSQPYTGQWPGQGFPPPYTGQGQGQVYPWTPPCTWQGFPWTPPCTGKGSPPPYKRQGSPPPYKGKNSPPPYTRQGSPPPYKGKGSPPPYTRQGSPPPYKGKVSPPSYTDQNSPQAYLDAHNIARAKVGVGKMTWNDTVAKYAKRYANIRKSDCALLHSVDNKYGECIAEGSDTQFSGVDAVNMWVRENTNYHYKSNTCDEGEVCGHYTQVVWKNSVHLGCARVLCDNDLGVFITCNYDPPGNYVGESPY